MIQKLRILFLFLTVSIASFSQVVNQPSDLEVCDDDNDGFSQFDLTFLDAQVLGSQSSADYTVTYHETQSDAANGVNALFSPYANIVNDFQTVFIRLEDNDSSDTATTSVNLIVNSSPIPVQPTSFNLCDDNADEIGIFDLSIKDAEITGANADWSVAYFLTNTDAQAQMNALSNSIGYSNTVNPQTLFVSVTDINTGCVGFTTLTIRVLPNPSGAMGTPNNLELCDDNNNGIAIFDLTVNEGFINPSGEIFTQTYYVTESDAMSASNPILNSNNFTNISNPQTIYVRVENPAGCFSLTSFNINVLPSPTPTPSSQIPNLILCDVNNTGDGEEVFDLTELETFILNGESQVAINYYETLEDADSGINPIPDPTQYTNIETSAQEIYVRVTNVATGCFTVVNFNIIVNPLPLVVEVADFIQCGLNTDGFASFDLTIKEAEVLNGQDATQFIVSYHESAADAETSTNALVSPYTNVTNPQQIFVTITNNVTSCSISTQSFNIEVQEAASANSDGTPILYAICDDTIETDGNPANDSAQFDLTILNPQLLDGQNPAIFTIDYYTTELDAELGVNPLPMLYQNSINPEVIYARVSNSLCFGVAALTLEVNPVPFFSIDDTSFCLGESVTIDTGLSTSNYSFEWSLNGVIISETQASLIAAQSGTYGVVVTDFNSGCSSSSTFVLDEVDCTDTDTDGVIDSNEDVNENGNLEDDDTDNDDIPNYLDDDDDGDNVDTIIEVTISSGRTNTLHAFIDTDDDMIENYLDDDDDGDNVLTIDEDYNNNGDPTDDDTNMNSIPDYLESAVALSLTDFNIVSFSMFPNPAKNKLTIQLASTNLENGVIEIYNIHGQEIRRHIKLEGHTSTLDITSLQSGIYFVKLISGSQTSIQKLIVN